MAAAPKENIIVSSREVETPPHKKRPGDTFKKEPYYKTPHPKRPNHTPKRPTAPADQGERKHKFVNSDILKGLYITDLYFRYIHTKNYLMGKYHIKENKSKFGANCKDFRQIQTEKRKKK